MRDDSDVAGLLAHEGGQFMSHPPHLKRSSRAAAALAVCAAFAAIPAAAAASPVNLATASPFVVLGGQAVTNTGPSVLGGDLGVSPGAALTLGAATVLGATHANDAVAAQAQLDVTTAYGVAAGQAVTADLTGIDLGGLSLVAGAYRFTSSAQLTGPLVLDAQNDPNAQFVFEIGSSLTTASASSVVLINGASPCNVYWQVGSSAALGSATAFQGNLMALTSISLNNAATVQGRLLARNGSVTLINNVITNSMCTTPATPPPGPDSGSGSGGAGSGSTGSGTVTPPPASGTTVETRLGTATLTRTPPPSASGQRACTAGFSATVRGRQIRSVVFRLDGRRVPGTTKSPFRVTLRAKDGRHKVTARVTFKDATRAKTLTLAYRACTAVALRPRVAPPHFTG
jgi:ice-binding like protein